MSYAANTDHKFLQLSEWTLGNYCSWDAYFTAGLVKPLMGEVRARGNWAYYIEVLEPLQRAVIDMQRRGLLLDRGALQDYRGALRDELRETDEVILQADPTGELRQPTDRFPNSIGSTKKLGRFLFETLGLKPLKKTEKDFNSTDQEALYRLLRDLRVKDQGTRPVLEALFHRSRLKTIYSRYLKLQPGPDGRIRATVKMTGAKTWRFAYAEPALQQWPPEIRHFFRAGPGNVFVAADYSKLEPSIQCRLAGDEPDIRAMEMGQDIYEVTADDLFGWERGSVAKLKIENRLKYDSTRGFSKSWRLGKGYGGRAESMKNKMYCPCLKCVDKVAPTLDLGVKDRVEAERRWEQRHPAYVKWWRELEYQVRRSGCYESPLGPYKTYFSQPWGSDLEREVKNRPMQLGAALLMNRRQVALHRLGAPIVLQHHDSFLLECLRDEAPHWAETLKATLEEPIPQLGGVVFPCKVEVGETWGSLEHFPV